MFMTVLLLVYNVCSIIVFPSQCHVITYKLERFDKLLISTDPFPSCNCMQLCPKQLIVGFVGEMEHRIVMPVCKKTLKRNVISVIKLI